MKNDSFFVGADGIVGWFGNEMDVSFEVKRLNLPDDAGVRLQDFYQVRIGVFQKVVLSGAVASTCSRASDDFLPEQERGEPLRVDVIVIFISSSSTSITSLVKFKSSNI